jgi:hypothetical protein
MLNKGLSQVIATVLMLFLALVSIFLVYSIYFNLVRDNSDEIEINHLSTKLEIISGSIMLDNNQIVLDVKRDSFKGDISSIKFLIYGINGEIDEFIDEYPINILEIKRFVIDLENVNSDNIEKIVVIPISNGKELLTGSDDYIFPKNDQEEEDGNDQEENNGDNQEEDNGDNQEEEFPNSDYKLKEINYEDEKLYLFKSSVHFRPLTQHGSNLYASFEDHRITRLPNVGYNLYNSGCLLESECPNSFMKNLKSNNLVKNEFIQNKNDKVIIPIHGMPFWLTGHNEEGYPPQDYEVWSNVVKEMVNYFKSYDGVEFYYEISNEPDLEEFWRSGTDEWLEFYKHTSIAIKEADPNAKVGGSAVNQWDGKIEDNRQPVNIELIRYAKKNNLDLDFISWHNYHTMDKILLAKNSYETELNNQGYVNMPEFVISEWNGPSSNLRGSDMNPVLMADSFFGFVSSDIDEETFYNLEDDFPESNPEGHRYYGLVTQQNNLRPVFYVYYLFDSVARNSQGIKLFIDDDKRIIISKRNESCYDIMLWTVKSLESNAEINYDISFDGKIQSANRVSVKSSYNNKEDIMFEDNRIKFSSEENKFDFVSICLA